MAERQPLLTRSAPTLGFEAINPNIQTHYQLNGSRSSDSLVPTHYQLVESTPTEETVDVLHGDFATQRNLEHPTSNMDTMIHLLKGNIGTGILAMPSAFKLAGLYVGLFSTLIIGAICTHCMYVLVRCAHELCNRLQTPSLTFSEVAGLALETSPYRWLRKYSKFARHTITTFLFLTQIGACCAYFVFVAFNIQHVVNIYYPHTNWNIKIYLLIILIPMIPLNFVRNLKYLMPVSLIATILTVAGLACTFYYILEHLPHIDTVRHVASWSSLPLYFGTAIYAFEGIGIVLPLENNMKTPKDFGGMSGVLTTGMTIVTCLYTAVGFFGYLKYGEHVEDSITLNLPSHEWLSNFVRLAIAIAVFLSYALQFYVPMNMLETLIDIRCENYRNCVSPALRVVLVIFTFIIAICIPNLGLIISLVGAVGSSTLALIAPPLIELITFWPVSLGRCNWILWKNVLILVFGISGFLFGTYANVRLIFKH